MISNDEANSAIDAAEAALSSKPELSWIRKSSLVTRAYYVGLIFGLGAIAKADDTSRLTGHLIKTLRRGVADDSFPSTSIGRAFEALRAGIVSEKPIGDQGRNDLLEALSQTLVNNERMHNKCLHRVQNVVARLSKVGVACAEGTADNELRHKLSSALSDLEEPLRILALLETSHLLDAQLGD